MFFTDPTERSVTKPKKAKERSVEPIEEKPRTPADDFHDQIEMLYSIPQKNWPRKEVKFSPSQLGKCARELYYLNTNAPLDPPQPVTPWKARLPRNGEGVHQATQRDYLEMHKKLQEAGLDWRFKMIEVEKPLRGEFKVNGFKVVISGRCDGILQDRLTGDLFVYEKKTKDKASNLTKIKEPQPEHILQGIAYALALKIPRVIFEIESLQKPQWSRDDGVDQKHFFVQVTDEQCDELLERLAGIVRAIEKVEVPPKELDRCTFCNYKEVCASDG